MKTHLVACSIRVLLIATVMSTGCLIIPVKERDATSGRKVETKETAEWRMGKTKRAEVLRQLGAPYAEFIDPNVIAYHWVVVSAVMPWLVAGGYTAVGGVEEIRQEHILLVAFDEADRVLKFEVVHHHFGSLHDHVKRWAASKGGAGGENEGSGKRSPNAKDTALLWVYRPGGWSEGINLFAVRILVDGKLAAEIKRNSFTSIPVSPGRHAVTGWMRAHPEDASDSVTLTAAAGQPNYVEAKITSGTGITSLRLDLVAPQAGRDAIRKMNNSRQPVPGDTP